ncbi:MAG: type II secretion protein [Nitrospirae bacterium]|nr:type II secretion protein [Nitrospirota bacterium]
MTYKTTHNEVKEGQQAERFLILMDWGVLTNDELRQAEQAAVARGIDIERVLIHEYGVPKGTLLAALSEYFKCPFVEYDERMPIPPGCLTGLDGERLSISLWFPIIHDGTTVIIAAHDPQDRRVQDEVRQSIKAEQYEFWVALEEDLQWFIQDFLHAKPGSLIGTERTGLAFWRNTMAHWRTRLACYRNDLAKGRTDLAILRWGLGLITLSDVLMQTHPAGAANPLTWLMMAAGVSLGVFGLSGYLTVRRTRMRTPGHQTLIEVTAATLQFLDAYHYLDQCAIASSTKGTMLARLGDCLGGHCTILFPSPASRERTHLARERNVLAAQRTVAACYRTIYARARTGLAFIRTGVSFTMVGFGLMHYFGFSFLTAFDALLIVAGVLMAMDGFLWYLPVRKEQAEIPRCMG